ncbi:NAD(P) transhydrogenase alpha subunit [hydrothermal vent metagenome]|uniref:proton-translocating NAD(P)(+) transhydrogenase n=1 Tax=hydrothermal vent metagenome TaxID=652676 RepID=A0A3B1D6S2_9ZZZZ
MAMINYFLIAFENIDIETSGTGKMMLLLMLFVLAIFVGVEIIAKIPPTLHTPLMSGSNAISGITIVGAILALKFEYHLLTQILGCLAVILATVNVVGGFMVTHRMLGMFRTKKKKPKTE